MLSLYWTDAIVRCSFSTDRIETQIRNIVWAANAGQELYREVAAIGTGPTGSVLPRLHGDDPVTGHGLWPPSSLWIVLGRPAAGAVGQLASPPEYFANYKLHRLLGRQRAGNANSDSAGFSRALVSRSSGIIRAAHAKILVFRNRGDWPAFGSRTAVSFGDCPRSLRRR